MARPFRLWGKKRGARRTGSELLGSVGEALFSAALFLLGVASLTALLAAHLTDPGGAPFRPGFGFWLMVLVLGSFVVLGGGGAIWTVFRVSVSAERRAVLTRRATSLDLTGETAAPPTAYPTVPSVANLVNSPGVKLRYRLPVVQSPAGRLIVATAFCLIWNGSASVLVGLVIHSLLSGRPQWFATLFTVPFLAIGIWSIYDFVRQMVIHTGIGPTNVEVSEHPLHPGGQYRVSLSQAGRLWLKVLTLNLVCEEVATYRQGTDIRTETKAVFDRQIFRRTDFRIEPGLPFEQECPLDIPEEAAPSFQSEHNAVNWKVVVRGTAEGWPPYERSFPIIVYPPHDGTESHRRAAAVPAHS